MTSISAGQKNITELLHLANEGDAVAQEKLFRTVYEELRRMARSVMRNERTGHTLQPTALVNEAFLRLVGNQIHFSDRTHFFSVAARTMRRVLVDHARSLAAQKRNPGQRVDLDSALGIAEDQLPELIALDVAMERLEATYPRACRVVELQFFTGASAVETAAILGVSLKTVRRDWKLARAWLYAEMARQDG
jgi:RNA polymerase sigma factor (TIGR02999 family)